METLLILAKRLVWSIPAIPPYVISWQDKVIGTDKLIKQAWEICYGEGWKDGFLWGFVLCFLVHYLAHRYSRRKQTAEKAGEQ